MNWPWLQAASLKWRRYPIALFGFVWGPVRLEATGGREWFPWRNKILLFKRPFTTWAFSTPDTFAVTHLQKRSRFGFLIMWPFCFHVWFQFKMQGTRVDDNGVTVSVPGSERVLYWRFGAGRWQASDATYICPTWYGPGLHWD